MVNAAFVVRMEDVLAVYERPDDPRFPVVCFDERHCVLHGQPVEPLPLVAAQPARGEQHVRTLGHRLPAGRFRTRHRPPLGQGMGSAQGADYCRFLQRPAAAHPQAEKFVLVQDNLNTHTDAAFYQYLPAPEARPLAARFKVHYTPKNASCLKMVELELSAIAR